jgi:excisionase family DNA binding protein
MGANRQHTGPARARHQLQLTPFTYGLGQAAALLGCSPGMLRLEIQRKRLAAKRLGSRVLITAEELQRYVAALEDA